MCWPQEHAVVVQVTNHFLGGTNKTWIASSLAGLLLGEPDHHEDLQLGQLLVDFGHFSVCSRCLPHAEMVMLKPAPADTTNQGAVLDTMRNDLD